MNENEVMQGDEISLFDLWEKLRDGWKAVVGGLVLGIAGAVSGIVLIPPKYEAVAVIQVGQVGQVALVDLGGQVGQVAVGGQPVEPPVQAVERMKTAAFQRKVAEALNDQEWLGEIARSATGSTNLLWMQVIKGTVGSQIPLIEVRAGGDSPEAAKRKVESAVAELVKAHAELAQPALARMLADLAINREKLASAERDLATLTKLVEAAGIKDDRFTQLALMTSLRIQKEAETFGQRQMIMALETALGAPATQSARAIEAVFVPEKPVSPKRSLLLALGAVGGLLAGVLWVFVADTRRRAKAARATR